jgi:hypothetical protein
MASRPTQSVFYVLGGEDCPIDVYVVNCTEESQMCTEFGHRSPVNDDRVAGSPTRHDKVLGLRASYRRCTRRHCKSTFTLTRDDIGRQNRHGSIYLVRCQDMMMHRSYLTCTEVGSARRSFRTPPMEALLEFFV